MGRVNHRMHNKSMTFDNQITIVGGRNIGEEYFDARPDMNYNDLDLLCIGPVVQEVSQAFDTYWNSAVAVPVLALVDAPKDPGSWHRYANNSPPTWQRPSRRRTGRPLSSSLTEAFAFRGEQLTWEQWTLVVDPPEKAQAGFEARRSELDSAAAAHRRCGPDRVRTRPHILSPATGGSSGFRGCGNGVCGSWL